MTSLIVYTWYRKRDQGFGNSTFKHGKEKFTRTELEELSKKICEAEKFDYIVILNIVPLANERTEMDDVYEHAMKAMREASRKTEKE